MSGPRVRSIVSHDNPSVRRWRRLLDDPGGYRRLGEVWIEGDHLCSAWLRVAGTRDWEAIVSETGWADPRLRSIAERATSVAVLADPLLGQLSTLESPPALCAVVPWQGVGRLDPAAPGVVLDRLQDPGNVGNILRSAAAFGFGQVVATTGTVGLWSPKVVRAAMGAHFKLRLVEAADAEVLDAIALPLIATSSHAASSLVEAPLPWPCCWVVGHEGQGIGAGLLARCGQVVRIPQPGGEESLNAAAAAAICFYESSRRAAAR